MAARLGDLIVRTADAARPPERLSVSESAEKYIRLNNPGSYSGPWKNETAPYLVEVMDALTDHDTEAVVMVAPAQSGKTAAGLCWLAYSMVCDPLNFMLVEKTQTDARDFSKTRIDPLILNSPALWERRGRSRHDDNVQDKRFSSGMTLLIRSPTVNTLAGKPMPRVFLTDYDRMDQDLGGEGSPFSLAKARTTSYGHFAMVLVESSPSFPILDPRWGAKTPHEAPPCEGILGLYNQGDRRRWMWVCVACDEAFEPDFPLLKWPRSDSHREAALAAWMECPHCNAKYTHEPGEGPGKHAMNAAGFWLIEGQRRLKGGQIIGQARASGTKSFWLRGVAAAFKPWFRIVEPWLNANDEYERTHSEELLKSTVNVDQGNPYLPKHLESERLPEELRERAIDMGERQVPEDVRFLVAAVDVQKRRFVVQVHGISKGGDVWVIDRFNIRFSLDPDEERPDQFRWVSPGYEAKDWRLLLREVMLKDYPLIDGSGRRMSIKAVICDSGGISGTTSNAYSFWRWLRRGPQESDEDHEEWQDEWTPGLHNRLALYKGEAKTQARAAITFPDSRKQGANANARGEIPVLLCNSNMLKDQLNLMLDRTSPGTGRIRFPKWLPISFYRELCAEIRSPEGKWDNPRGFRNESWDLLVMTLALLIERRYVGSEHINWDKPPEWASGFDTNPFVFYQSRGDNPVVSTRKKDKLSFRELGKKLS